MTKHKKESGENKFCTVRGKPCKCGNDYTSVVGSNFEERLKYPLKVSNRDKPLMFKFQAHHILCVGSVNSKIYSNDYIENIVKETEWCVNNKDNMVSMPVLAHTIWWYVHVCSGEYERPSFENICQHNWDHTGNLGYKWEVDNALVQLAYDVEEGGHGPEAIDLAEALNAESKHFRGELEARAIRQSGTHQAWLDGESNPQGPWYEPFSMANTAYISKKTFPVGKFEKKVLAWMERFKKAVGG